MLLSRFTSSRSVSYTHLTWSDTEDKPQGCKWFGQTICPRELHIKDGRIFQTPVRELDAVHGKRTFHENVTAVSYTHLDVYKRQARVLWQA